VAHAVTRAEERIPGFSQIFGIPSIFFRENLFSQINNVQGEESWYVIRGNTIDTETIMRPVEVDFMVDTSPYEQQKQTEAPLRKRSNAYRTLFS
jgi:hypothetical protein